MPELEMRQLEERVSLLMKEFRRLKEENQELLCQIDQLNRKEAAMEKEKSLSRRAQDRLLQLETMNQKNAENRVAARTKVQALLKNLEKFDLT